MSSHSAEIAFYYAPERGTAEYAQSSSSAFRGSSKIPDISTRLLDIPAESALQPEGLLPVTLAEPRADEVAATGTQFAPEEMSHLYGNWIFASALRAL